MCPIKEMNYITQHLTSKTMYLTILFDPFQRLGHDDPKKTFVFGRIEDNKIAFEIFQPFRVGLISDFFLFGFKSLKKCFTILSIFSVALDSAQDSVRPKLKTF